jgi:hypothetical protein
MIIKRLKRLVRLTQHHLHLACRDRWLKARLARQWKQRMRSAPAPAPSANALVVSLTSYPPRFPTLHLTLQSLLLQNYVDRRVVLWIARQDVAQLPPAVRALTAHGLDIRTCDDTRSYKKLLPALQAYPDATIVTADDDLYYWPEWLQQLVDAAAAAPGDIVAHRIHRIRHSAAGLPLPYRQWEVESQNNETSGLNFPTGNGGILYPPGILSPLVQDREAYTSLCPSADDIWFYWMGRLNGARYRRVDSCHTLHDWQGSQALSLSKDNVGTDRNDQQIAAMIGRYGYVNKGTTVLEANSARA